MGNYSRWVTCRQVVLGSRFNEVAPAPAVATLPSALFEVGAWVRARVRMRARVLLRVGLGFRVRARGRLRVKVRVDGPPPQKIIMMKW